MKNGVGKLLWPNGSHYNGNWKHDYACGEGVFIHGNVKYEGLFDLNEPV